MGLAVGTGVIREAGGVDAVERIRCGDLLLGPDGRARRVCGVSQVEGPLFEISSTSASPLFAAFQASPAQTLVLKHSGAVRHGDRFLFAPYVRGDHVEVSVGEHSKKSAHFRRLLKGFKSGPIDLPPRALPLDPYFVGLWLGDGSSDTAAVTTMDPEIREYMHRFGESHGLSIRVKAPHRTAPTYCLTPGHRGGNMRDASARNPVLTALRGLGLLGRKHIPQPYQDSSVSQRRAMLAGLLDSDGHLNETGGYTIATKWAHLSEEIVRLAASLGLAARARSVVTRCRTASFDGYRVGIYGAGVEELPLLLARKRSPTRRPWKDALRSGIAVRPAGAGISRSIDVDGDGLFMLRDFTVVRGAVVSA